MSVIQKIRDKYARWAVIAIAVSLLGFILMDAFAGRTGLFNNGPGSTLGKVNGTSINRIAFEKKVEEYVNRLRAQQEVNEETIQQIRNNMWETEVTNIVMDAEYEKLGLTVTDKELRDILYGDNPPADLAQQFTDQKTGKFNAVAAEQYINQAKKDPLGKENIQNYFDYLKKQRLMNKYTSMLTRTVYYPKWFLEKKNADNSQIAKITYVNIPYTTIPDSTIKVSDDDIQDFINERKDDFEQKIETRSINFVQFSAAPSKADSLEAYNSLLALKAGFDTTSDAGQFVQANGTSFPYYDRFLSKNAIQQQNKDSILNAPVGQAYGPYLDVNNQSGKGLYVMSKIVAVKQWPDTVKARHILINVARPDPQTGQMTEGRDDSSAKRLIDSINGLLAKGERFDSLAAKFSDDGGSKFKGGVYDSIPNGKMVPEFNDFIFDHKVGTRDIVKTEFGYHIVEILSQKGSGPVYKIAYLTKDILPSNETDQEAHNKANLFAGDSRDLEAFNSNYDKKLRTQGLQKMIANDIDPMASSVNGIAGQSRSFVKKIFDADKGDVLDPEKVGDAYVVAVITEVNKPGVISVSRARPYVEPTLRNKKKAEQIIKNIGQITTPEQIAAKTNQQVQTLDSIRLEGDRKIAYEPKVIGAAFNPANKGKVISQAIAGQNGVYVVRVDNQSTAPVETANIEEQRKALEMQDQQQRMSQMQQGRDPIVETLKRLADIKDNRWKFY